MFFSKQKNFQLITVLLITGSLFFSNPGCAADLHAIIVGDMLENAQPSFNQAGQPVVSFRLNSLGARKFCDVTRKNVGQPFAIVLDNKIISAPRINEAICGGSGQISGGFDVKEAGDLASWAFSGRRHRGQKVIQGADGSGGRHGFPWESALQYRAL